MKESDFAPTVAPVPIVHCRHCRFWDAHMITRPTRTPEGLCRRKAPAPAIVADDADTGTSWPKLLKMIGAAKANRQSRLVSLTAR